MKTDYDFCNDELKIVEEKAFSDGERAAVKCYGANDVLEGVAIMKHEGVDVSITGNSPTRPASSIWLPARIRSGPSRTTARTSPLLPAAARAVPCTRTTWRLARLPMA